MIFHHQVFWFRSRETDDVFFSTRFIARAGFQFKHESHDALTAHQRYVCRLIRALVIKILA